jgi:hypothetical protein
VKKTLTILSLLFIFISAIGFANEKPKGPKSKTTILLSGKIYDAENQELLAGVKIVCGNCSKTFYSDLNGRFFIHFETETTDNLKLEFSQIGYSSKSVDVKDLQSSGDNLAIDLSASK